MQREWTKRWNDFPRRAGVALAKYHAIILVMRFYEHVASKIVDKYTLDKLTIDTFESSKRSAKGGKQGRYLAGEVFHTCMWANLISYMADYSVHEFILVFGYYVYVKERRRQRRKLPELADADIHGGSLALSLMKSSTLLALSRAVALLFSSIGGALGSLITPAWGSLAGSNLGDALAMALAEEVISPNAPTA